MDGRSGAHQHVLLQRRVTTDSSNCGPQPCTGFDSRSLHASEINRIFHPFGVSQLEPASTKAKRVSTTAGVTVGSQALLPTASFLPVWYHTVFRGGAGRQNSFITWGFDIFAFIWFVPRFGFHKMYIQHKEGQFLVTKTITPHSKTVKFSCTANELNDCCQRAEKCWTWLKLKEYYFPPRMLAYLKCLLPLNKQDQH